VNSHSSQFTVMQVLKFQSSPSLLPNPQAQRTQLRRRVRHAGPAPLKNAYEVWRDCMERK
jgi:hypothetical protein